MTNLSDAACSGSQKVLARWPGSAISLAYMLPHGRREAALRFITGTLCGLIFGGTAGLKIAIELGIDKMMSANEIVLMGSAIASACAWWALGFVMRAFDGMKRD